METPAMDNSPEQSTEQAKQLAMVAISVQIPHDLYAVLIEQIQLTGKNESDFVTHGLRQVLSRSITQDHHDHERFHALELSLEQRLKQYVEELVKERVSLSTVDAFPNSDRNTPENSSSEDRRTNLPMPTIRPLQVGDRVLVLEPDSPYYMAKLLVTKTSLIRATVNTETGEKTFLKRDLRFVEATKD
ncbi:hypothetical protein [Pseudanabaena mucicola]|uniref:Uncharacterized protein n=1 Tax=Pseudanabaena mucicola FACHB-723 TaxID=2692860 RepID=A0ABR7ZVH2_9CYAN|nr:hypothetical protein [Pseudanabaena mucicola]MBD2187802.1 hypothetical protein [Pseudanabaena mucicola FACHB-723]